MNGIHVVPVNDLIEHDTDGGECVCGPDYEYVDAETGCAYPGGPVVIHHSLDGREREEQI